MMPPNKTNNAKKQEENCTSIFRNIMHLKHKLNGVASHIASSLDLRVSEMAIIDTLGKYGPLTMSNLATACFFSPPNATYTVRALEKRKLLVRNRCADSQRVVRVQLTAAGEKVFRNSYPKTIQAVTTFLADRLDETERSNLEKLLNKLVQ